GNIIPRPPRFRLLRQILRICLGTGCDRGHKRLWALRRETGAPSRLSTQRTVTAACDPSTSTLRRWVSWAPDAIEPLPAALSRAQKTRPRAVPSAENPGFPGG